MLNYFVGCNNYTKSARSKMETMLAVWYYIWILIRTQLLNRMISSIPLSSAA